MAQAAVGFLLGLDGYLRYAGQVAEGTSRLTDAVGFSIGVSGLSLFAYVMFTPQGLLSAYLFLAGTFRAIASAVGPTPGDPLLAAGRVLYRRYRRRSEAERAQAARQALEGPAAPDVLDRGPTPEHPDALWTVIASRTKPGWDRGVFVVTTDRWYRIAEVADRATEAGLRRVYVLEPVGAAEVIRRSVYYDHPELSLLHDRKSTPAADEPAKS